MPDQNTHNTIGAARDYAGSAVVFCAAVVGMFAIVSWTRTNDATADAIMDCTTAAWHEYETAHGTMPTTETEAEMNAACVAAVRGGE